MDFNYSIYATFLTMESLNILPSYILPAFIFGILTYGVILLFNFMIVLTIAFNRKLHKPMYILLFNLPVNDMMGATAFFPQLVSSMFLQKRTITYSACFMQGLLVHIYGAGSLVILSAMAYDRYIAICFPLKYNCMMSSNNLLKIIIIMWMVDCTLIGLLFVLNYHKEICSTKIVDIFCNSASLMKLICGDIKLNNYYALFVTFFLQGLSLLIIVLTYIHILFTCISRRQSNAKSKAIQTCGTHLIVFLCFEFNALFAIIAHRFEDVSPTLRSAFGASVMIFPPILNPLIYGLKTKEIRQNIFCFFHKLYPQKQKTKVFGINQVH